MKSRLSIRTLVALAMNVPIVAVSAALVWLSIGSSHSIAEKLGVQIVGDATRNVQAQVPDYLTESMRTSELYARRIESGVLPTGLEPGSSLKPWERFMLDDLATRPKVASICWGNANGDAIFLTRAGKSFEIGGADGATHAQVIEKMHTDGKRGPVITGRPDTYDPRQRPWYTAAMEKRAAHWTPVYFWYGESGDAGEVGTGFTRPVYKADGTLAGVIVIDTTLGSISEFLKKLPVTREGSVYLVDEDGLIVAASDGQVVTADQKRLALSASPSPAARAAASLLEQVRSSGVEKLDTKAPLEDDTARVSISRVSPLPGINWRAIVVVPENSFLSQARSVQRNAMMMALFAVLAVLVLGFALARKITDPLLAMTRHVARIGRGELDAELKLDAASELVEVSDALNRMAADLRNRVQLLHSLAVATQVQQSLLPAASPTSQRLDIYGASRYCDEAGGDYYDFIEIGDLPDQRALVAVGDVMGHGIGAALLMATARAALRATALRSGALGELLTAVNTVLARDNRHGRFMTMLLVMLEPEQGTMRWASAGHDPVMLYEPRANDFIELVGGDVPLGVEEQTRYEEYSFPCLNPHQVMLLGTDGIWEARNAAGEQFGKERLRDVMRANIDRTAREIARAIDTALAAHLAGAANHDDVTFVIVKVLPVGQPVARRFSAGERPMA